MDAKAKKIELYLYNGTLNGMIYVSESDGWDLGGILYSCPRESTDILLNDDSCDKTVFIPETLNSQVVDAIGPNAFADKKLINITIKVIASYHPQKRAIPTNRNSQIIVFLLKNKARLFHCFLHNFSNPFGFLILINK